MSGVKWDEIPEHRIEIVYEQWQALPEAKRIAVERVFEDAEELSNEQGIQAIVEEGQFHGLDLAPELDQLDGFRDKVMWVALHHPRVFEVAGIINRAHTLPQRYWRRRGGLPNEQPDVSEGAIAGFAHAIGAYYRQTQGRGHHCTVDAYLRINRYHYFFAYPDDYADTYLGYDDDGHFVRRPQKPAFEVVFIFDPEDGRLDIFAKGGKEVHEALQTLFCRSLLGQELPPESPNSHPYELNGLESRDFRFPTDPEDGIDEVRIRKLRLSVLGNQKRRIMLEANPKGRPDDIYEMLEKYLNRENVPDALINVTLAPFHFRWFHTGQGRRKTLTFDVSFPDKSNLKSNKREEMRLIGQKYLTRWGIDRA